MILGRYRQHPEDFRRRMVDYRDFLETGEVITGVVPSVVPVTDTPLVVTNVIVDVAGKRFAYRVSGGEHGETYSVNFQITTNAGQVKNDTIEFDIEEDE